MVVKEGAAEKNCVTILKILEIEMNIFELGKMTIKTNIVFVNDTAFIQFVPAVNRDNILVR